MSFDSTTIMMVYATMKKPAGQAGRPEGAILSAPGLIQFAPYQVERVEDQERRKHKGRGA